MTDATADQDVEEEEKKGGMTKIIGAGGAVVVLLAVGYFFLAGVDSAFRDNITRVGDQKSARSDDRIIFIVGLLRQADQYIGLDYFWI